MLIRCKIERKNGTTVTLGDKTYRFTPVEAGGHHVAKVEDQAHIDTLLAIQEAYEPAPGEKVKPRTVKDDFDFAAEQPAGAPEDVEDTSQEVEQETAGDDLDDLDMDALKLRYQQVLGTKPHHAKKRETLIHDIRVFM